MKDISVVSLKGETNSKHEKLMLSSLNPFGE